MSCFPGVSGHIPTGWYVFRSPVSWKFHASPQVCVYIHDPPVQLSALGTYSISTEVDDVNAKKDWNPISSPGGGYRISPENYIWRNDLVVISETLISIYLEVQKELLNLFFIEFSHSLQGQQSRFMRTLFLAKVIPATDAHSCFPLLSSCSCSGFCTYSVWRIMCVGLGASLRHKVRTV